jgi:uncharacterized protein (DUF305 family)
MRRFTLIMGIAVSAVIIAACGDNGTSSTASAASQFNNADATFAQNMIPHHQQAVEMAGLALDPKAGASVKTKDIATRTQHEQGSEITMMRTVIQAWGRSEMSADMGGMNMPGMMSTADMTALAKLNGAQFDRSWAQAMIKHHQGAIEMATTVKKTGNNSQARTLADRIIATQSAAITELQTLTK